LGDAVAKATASAKTEVANLARALPKGVPATVFQTLLDSLNHNRISDQKEIASIRDVKLKAAEDRIAKLERDLASAAGASATQGGIAATSTGGFNFGSIAQGQYAGPAGANPLQSASPSLSALQQEMQDFKRELISIKADRDAAIVRFGALGFRNYADAQAYVLANLEAMNFGLIVDAYSVSLLVTKEIDGEANYLKKLETVKKLNLESALEANALIAFSAPVPDLFTEPGRGIIGQDDSAFLKYPTFKKFKKSLEQIKAALIRVKGGLRENISGALTTSSSPYNNAVLSVTEACSNLTALCEWIERTHESLEDYGMVTRKAWALTTRLSVAYFQAMNKVRTGIAISFNTSDRHKLAATVWYGVTRTQDIPNTNLRTTPRSLGST
jgi:hypothetical protein